MDPDDIYSSLHRRQWCLLRHHTKCLELIAITKHPNGSRTRNCHHAYATFCSTYWVFLLPPTSSITCPSSHFRLMRDHRVSIEKQGKCCWYWPFIQTVSSCAPYPNPRDLDFYLTNYYHSQHKRALGNAIWYRSYFHLCLLTQINYLNKPLLPFLLSTLINLSQALK